MLYPAELWVQKRRRRENPPFSGILSEASGSGGTQWHNASCIVSGSAEPPSYPFESPGFSSRQYKKRRGRDSNPRYSYPYNSLAGSPIQPLSHLSKVVNQQISTEKVGFALLLQTSCLKHSGPGVLSGAMHRALLPVLPNRLRTRSNPAGLLRRRWDSNPRNLAVQ